MTKLMLSVLALVGMVVLPGCSDSGLPSDPATRDNPRLFDRPELQVAVDRPGELHNEMVRAHRASWQVETSPDWGRFTSVIAQAVNSTSERRGYAARVTPDELAVLFSWFFRLHNQGVLNLTDPGATNRTAFWEWSVAQGALSRTEADAIGTHIAGLPRRSPLSRRQLEARYGDNTDVVNTLDIYESSRRLWMDIYADDSNRGSNAVFEKSDFLGFLDLAGGIIGRLLGGWFVGAITGVALSIFIDELPPDDVWDQIGDNTYGNTFRQPR